MSMSYNPGTYADVRRVLDTALANGGRLIYELPTPGKAVRFRQRCYSYRKLLFEEAKKTPGALQATKYDELQLRLVDNKVVFTTELEGKMTTPEGEALLPVLPPLDEEAEALIIALKEKGK